jgi:hypothetical protein
MVIGAIDCIAILSHRPEALTEVAVEEIADLSHYRMTRGSADLIRRLLARQEDGLQCHGG